MLKSNNINKGYVSKGGFGINFFPWILLVEKEIKPNGKKNPKEAGEKYKGACKKGRQGSGAGQKSGTVGKGFNIFCEDSGKFEISGGIKMAWISKIIHGPFHTKDVSFKETTTLF